MGRHPGKHELLAYAESLFDKRNPLSVRTGGHIADCRRCLAEVEAMRASLEFVGRAPDLEPSPEFTAQVLLAAQNERKAVDAARRRWSALVAGVKGAGYAAAIVVLSVVCFTTALKSVHAGSSLQAEARFPAPDAAPSPEAIRKAAADIQTLASAVSHPSRKPPSVWELEHRRAASALNADIESARAALARNPGCARASRVMDTNLQRYAQTLKTLYLERNL